MHNRLHLETIYVAFTYKPLWKLLIDKDMTKKELMQNTGISKSTVDKMVRGDFVSMEIIDRLCNYFNCDICNVLSHCKDNAK